MNRLVYNVVLSRYEINDSEYQRGNHKLTIQRIWPHMVQKTKKNKTGQNTTQHVLDTTMHMQTQIT